MMMNIQNFIGNKFVDSDAHIDVFNPATGAKIT